MELKYASAPDRAIGVGRRSTGSARATLIASHPRQVDLARRLGRPQSFVSKYESGERRVDLVELRAICGELGVSLVDRVRRFERLLQ